MSPSIEQDLREMAGMSLEECLVQDLKPIAPVVALVREGDLASLGAAKFIATDADWKDRALQLAREARLVVMLVGDTPAMRWELSQIPAVCGWHSFMLLIPPPKSLAKTVSGKPVPQQRSLESVWANLRSVCPQLPELPPHTALVSFDENGRPFASTVPKPTIGEWRRVVAERIEVQYASVSPTFLRQIST